jgi:hypothetical protein
MFLIRDQLVDADLGAIHYLVEKSLRSPRILHDLDEPVFLTDFY